MTVALRSGFQRLRVHALVAVFLATQFWEWYPLFHLVVKAFEPTALLAVDASLRLPREVRWVCEAAPSRFEYVEMLAKEEKKERKEEVTFSFQKPQQASEKKEEKKEEKEEKKKEEPKSFEVMNGSRITVSQWDVMCVPEQRYEMVVKDERMKMVIAVVKDRKEGEYTAYLDLKNGEEATQKYPEPFVYTIPPPPKKDN